MRCHRHAGGSKAAYRAGSVRSPAASSGPSAGGVRRFRDLRGVSHGTWAYTISGESPAVSVEEGDTRLSDGNAYVRIAVLETITSKSAPPLVDQPAVPANQGRISASISGVSAPSRRRCDPPRPGMLA